MAERLGLFVGLLAVGSGPVPGTSADLDAAASLDAGGGGPAST